MASQILKRHQGIILYMKILAVETSCDETAAAIIEDGTKIITNIVATSANMHAASGGVIPENAAREQIKSIIPVIKESMAGTNIEEIDALAVTIGPGLIGSLLVGVETAKTLSYLWHKPLIPVNHLVGHIYANWLNQKNLPEFPLLALVVSGGHTDLVLMKSHRNLKYLGGTRDDAAGEAFDKTARLLDLPYPGGPNLSKLAQKFIDKNPDQKLDFFPRPMIYEDNLDWSFSGLKTAVANFLKKNNKVSKEETAAQVQEAIVDSLLEKCLKALKFYQPTSFLLAGGVSANTRLREKFHARIFASLDSGKLPPDFLHIPEIGLCTDNAAYIGSAAFFNNHPLPWQTHSANPELTITDKIY